MRENLLIVTAVLFTSVTLRAGNSVNGFTENKGQFSSGTVLFSAKANGAPVIYLSDKGLSYFFTQSEKRNGIPDPNAEPEKCAKKWSRMDMLLLNADIKKENAVMEISEPGYSNFYYGNCPQGILNVKTFRHLTIKNIYPGIDWSLFVNEKNNMEYDFIVHPGADPSQIKIIYKGADELLLSKNKNELKLFSSCGNVSEGKLFTYQKENGQAVPSFYKMKENKISFAVAEYDRSKTLVIDPPLQWSSQQAGSGNEYAYSVVLTTDATNQTLVTGTTDSPDFPVLNAYQGTMAGNEDLFVQRLNTNGTRLWSTYYGGDQFDGGKGIATDNSGNAYVAGYTGGGTFPVLNNVQAGYGGGTYDAAFLKFNTAGVRQWATWYGGSGTDYSFAVCSDNAGNIFTTGYTNSADFPVVNAIYSTHATAYDAFVMKINPSSSVRWADFFGGNDDDKGRAITLDAANANVYFTGSTLSSVLHTTNGVFQNFNASFLNAEDVFIAKMDTAGQNTLFSTFCGGSDADFGQGIAVDASNNVFVTGYTLSSDFPTVNPGSPAYYDSTIGSTATHDAFILECNSTGTTEIWGTYYGGTSVDLGMAITADQSTGVHVTGFTSSTDFPTQAPIDLVYYQGTQADGGSFNDFFIGWFYSNHKMSWSTFYGGQDNDEGHSIASDVIGNVYVAGIDSTNALVLKFGPGSNDGVHSIGNNNDISIFPQPATDQLQLVIENSKNEKGEVHICDALGKELFSFVLSEKNTSIDVSRLAAGIYFLRYISGNETAVKKFIKQ